MKPDLLVVTDAYETLLEALAEDYAVHYLPGAVDPAAFLAPIRERIRGVLTNGTTGIGDALIRELPALEIICCLGAGYEGVDLASARERGIVVTNGRNTNGDAAAEIAIALMLAASRRIVAAEAYARSGRWAREGRFPLRPTVSGKRLGIVGLGNVGTRVARRAAAFDMEIAYHGPREKPGSEYRHFPDLVALAAFADFLVLSCPGGPATRGLVSAEVLAALGPSGTLVNVARGSVVDTEALVAALAAGTLGGAALDVFVGEPGVPEALTAFDNVVLTPHIGGRSIESFAEGLAQVRANLEACFAGRPAVSPVPG